MKCGSRRTSVAREASVLTPALVAARGAALESATAAAVAAVDEGVPAAKAAPDEAGEAGQAGLRDTGATEDWDRLFRAD